MQTKHINLALQGGGAHGAFTWGVLDRLLDEDWIEIDAISGTSAGALNGAALKAGLAGGKPAQTRRRPNRRHNAQVILRELWGSIPSHTDKRLTSWMGSLFPVPQGMNRIIEAFSPSAWLDQMTRVYSPYDSGVFYSNPLAPIAQALDFEAISSQEGPELFVAATNVRSGKIRVFGGAEVTLDAVLASACLPTVFQAVEIEDPKTGILEAYWDGGFTGNPPLFPLFEPRLPSDIMIVHINPMIRETVPTSPVEIEDRVNEISFNSSLLRELRAIDFVHRLIAEGRIPEGAMKDVRIHLVGDDEVMTALGTDTKILPDEEVMTRLMTAGQAAADRFLTAHADDLGQRSTIDLRAMFS
ncbi:patatin-like phospholipase family protein [Albirhodobacter sp. R86504]|jgi:NTE family protein|uniref:patatin-like phospholipase family protein n=1 Tax=Albirhodobacter sp. R86504 TaxID=3093848 RepID=UPI00366ED1F0